MLSSREPLKNNKRKQSRTPTQEKAKEMEEMNNWRELVMEEKPIPAQGTQPDNLEWTKSLLMHKNVYSRKDTMTDAKHLEKV